MINHYFAVRGGFIYHDLCLCIATCSGATWLCTLFKERYRESKKSTEGNGYAVHI